MHCIVTKFTAAFAQWTLFNGNYFMQIQGYFSFLTSNNQALANFDTRRTRKTGSEQEQWSTHWLLLLAEAGDLSGLLLAEACVLPPHWLPTRHVTGSWCPYLALHREFKEMKAGKGHHDLCPIMTSLHDVASRRLFMKLLLTTIFIMTTIDQFRDNVNTIYY